MPAKTPPFHHTFRITIDVETSINPLPRQTVATNSQEVCAHQAFVRQLQIHPEVLHQLLRSVAVDTLEQARNQIKAEYGWGRVPEQQLLSSIIEELEPTMQASFYEEIEEGVSVWYFDEYEATVKRFEMTELHAEAV
jgi:hypothetical protein